MLLHAKGWTAVVILSLALGIGANTAIFSGVNALLLTQIPVKDPDSLVRLRWGGRNDMVTSSSDYGFSNTGQGRPERPDDVLVSDVSAVPRRQQDDERPLRVCAVRPRQRRHRRPGGDCHLLRLDAATTTRRSASARGSGRTIVPDDDKPTAPPVAMISSKYWHTRFTTDPAVVGKTIRVNNVAVTIVGVLPPEFTGVQQPVARRRTSACRWRSSRSWTRSTPEDAAPGASRPTGGCRSWAG